MLVNALSLYSDMCDMMLTVYAVLHFGQMIRYKLWWLIPTVIFAGLAECLGWSGRLWSSQNAPLDTPFLIQWVQAV